MMLMVWLILCLQCSSLLVLLIPGRNLWWWCWWCWCCWFFDGKFACGAHSWSVWFLEEKYDNDDDDDDDDALVELLLVLFFTPGRSYSWRKNQRFKGSWSWLPPPEISKVHTIIMCWEMHFAEVGRVSAQLRNTLCSALLDCCWKQNFNHAGFLSCLLKNFEHTKDKSKQGSYTRDSENKEHKHSARTLSVNCSYTLTLTSLKKIIEKTNSEWQKTATPLTWKKNLQA